MITHTPGVYIQEKSILPASVAGVSTAVPLFIGFTEKPQANPVRITSLFDFENTFGGAYVPTFDVSLNTASNELEVAPDKRFFLHETLALYFTNGGGPCHIISANTYDPSYITVDNVTTSFTGVSSLTHINDSLDATISLIDKLDEVTLVLMPDLHSKIEGDSLIGNIEYKTLVNKLINECGELEDKKFAILDYHQADTTTTNMRDWLGGSQLKYSAMYYPWLKNAIITNVDFDNITGHAPSSGDKIRDINADLISVAAAFPDGTTIGELNANHDTLSNTGGTSAGLKAVFSNLVGIVRKLEDIEKLPNITAELTSLLTTIKSNDNFINEVQKLIRFIFLLEDNSIGNSNTSYISSIAAANKPIEESWFNFNGVATALGFGAVENLTNNFTVAILEDGGNPPINKTREVILTEFNQGDYVDYELIFASVNELVLGLKTIKQNLIKNLFASDPTYIDILSKIDGEMKKTLSQGAIAGIYCKNDRERGVWKSPANISVQGIEKPLVEVSNRVQDGLNVHEYGKSINVIRTFSGKGALVWGARTLAGNDTEWKYIAVRRFFNYAEESIRKAMSDFVFEPNNARTWVKIKAMVTSFLIEQWRLGALVGTSTDQAFFVNVGEETTSSTEILEGKINVQIGMAVARPAEFIIIEISHKLTDQ